LAKSGTEKPTFLDLLTSPLTLGPAVLGVSAAIVAWAMEMEEYILFSVGLGLAVAVAMFVTLFFVKGVSAGGSRVPPEIQKARDEMLANLESISRSLQRRGATEGTSAGTIAPVEK